jgi:hypothetical protein
LMVLRMNVADLITSSPNAASQYDEYIKRWRNRRIWFYFKKRGTAKIVKYKAVPLSILILIALWWIWLNKKNHFGRVDKAKIPQAEGNEFKTTIFFLSNITIEPNVSNNQRVFEVVPQNRFDGKQRNT